MKHLLIIIAFFSTIGAFAQEEGELLPLMPPDHIQHRDNGIRVAFYNLENLFDIENDSIKRDDDFTPTGIKGWSKRKYYRKLNNTYKVCMAVGGWEPPAVFTVCEAENRFVLEQLIQKTPLKKFNYKIEHFEAPDKRGIDVGLLYRPDKFEPTFSEPITINFPGNPDSKTRDILHVKGKVLGKDEVHIFVNHWPSKFGGHVETDPKRAYVASVLKAKVDEIYAEEPEANIIILGDFNDSPMDESVLEVLGAKPDPHNLQKNDLYNYMYDMVEQGLGTHQHSDYWENWSVIDQIIVSAPLYQRQKGLCIAPEGGMIYKERWLLDGSPETDDDTPFRTYRGAEYIGGFSDHLPIYVDLIYR